MWIQNIDEIMQKIGLIKCKTGHCVYVKGDGINIILKLLCVDDLILTCSNTEFIES